GIRDFHVTGVQTCALPILAYRFRRYHCVVGARVVFDRCVEVRVFRWLKRKRLDGAAQRKLTIAMAHAEEELIDTHVENVLEMYETLADDMPIGELLDLYLEEYEPSDQRAGIVARRVLAQLA